jgi:hypothetical protein
MNQHTTGQEHEPEPDGEPKFGKLLLVLIVAVLFCIALTWVMGEYFPNFPG